MTNSSTMNHRLQELLQFVLSPANSKELLDSLATLDYEQFDDFVSLLDKNHVLVRALTPLQELATSAGDSCLVDRILAALAAEHERIREALQSLEHVCAELEASGCPVVVIKTLEHWPDFGSDLDLFSTGDERCVSNLLRDKCQARPTMRSVGDFLSHKRSFRLPGLRTPVEVHISRLGQAGELVELAKQIVIRRKPLHLNGYVFQVPAPEERVIITSLERMYRHLYFRICDILNLSSLLQSDNLLSLNCNMRPSKRHLARCCLVLENRLRLPQLIRFRSLVITSSSHFRRCSWCRNIIRAGWLVALPDNAAGRQALRLGTCACDPTR